MERLRRSITGIFNPERGQQKRTVFDSHAHFLKGGYQKVLPFVKQENRGKQLCHTFTPDRATFMPPTAIPTDLDIDVSTEGRIPQMHRRRAAPITGFRSRCYRLNFICC